MYCAVDLGSTKTEILLFAEDFRLIGSSSFPTPFERRDGVVFLAPAAYFEAILNHLGDLLAREGTDLGEDFFLTVTGMGSTILAAAGDGKVLVPALSWEFVVPGETFEKKPTSRTGKFLLPTYPLYKIPWLKERCGGAEALFLSLPDYVLSAFTGFASFFTDYSFASRSLLFDDAACDWDEEILASAGLGRDELPVPGEAGSLRGEVPKALVKKLGLKGKAWVCLGMHDHVATGYLGSLLSRDRGRILINPAGTTESIVAWSEDASQRGPLVAEAPAYGINTESAWQKNILALVTYPCLSGKIFTTARGFGFDPERLRDEKAPLFIAPMRRRLEVGDRGVLFPPEDEAVSLDEFWRGLILGTQFEFRRAVEDFEKLLGRDKFERVFLFGGQGRDASLCGLKARTIGFPVSVFHDLNGAALGATLKIAQLRCSGEPAAWEGILGNLTERILSSSTDFLPVEGLKAEMDEFYERYRYLCEKAARKEIP